MFQSEGKGTNILRRRYISEGTQDYRSIRTEIKGMVNDTIWNLIPILQITVKQINKGRWPDFFFIVECHCVNGVLVLIFFCSNMEKLIREFPEVLFFSFNI